MNKSRTAPMIRGALSVVLLAFESSFQVEGKSQQINIKRVYIFIVGASNVSRFDEMKVKFLPLR